MEVSFGYPFQFHSISPSPIVKIKMSLLITWHRELYYWKSFQKIQKFSVSSLRYEERYAKDVDLWVHFATKAEEFTLSLYCINDQTYYEFPQFAYKNSSFRELVLQRCQLNPCGSVNWSSLVSLKIGYVKLTNGAMKKVLSGCPNLECLELEQVSGLRRFEISSVKLRELTIQDYYAENLEILAPYIQHLEILGKGSEIRIGQENVASLETAILRFNFDFEDEERNLDKECSYFKELLHGVVHVENLELGSWCIELEGWQSPPSSRKFLEIDIALERLDFPGICSFLQSSSDLETLAIDCWYNPDATEQLSRYTNEDEHTRKFETRPHLKTIKIDNFYGSLSENKSVLSLVKYLLKHASVLEKFVLAATFLGSDVSQDYVKMAQEILSFPRSSPHASVVFSY